MLEETTTNWRIPEARLEALEEQMARIQKSMADQADMWKQWIGNEEIAVTETPTLSPNWTARDVISSIQQAATETLIAKEWSPLEDEGDSNPVEIKEAEALATSIDNLSDPDLGSTLVCAFPTESSDWVSCPVFRGRDPQLWSSSIAMRFMAEVSVTEANSSIRVQERGMSLKDTVVPYVKYKPMDVSIGSQYDGMEISFVRPIQGKEFLDDPGGILILRIETTNDDNIVHARKVFVEMLRRDDRDLCTQPNVVASSMITAMITLKPVVSAATWFDSDSSARLASYIIPSKVEAKGGTEAYKTDAVLDNILPNPNVDGKVGAVVVAEAAALEANDYSTSVISLTEVMQLLALDRSTGVIVSQRDVLGILRRLVLCGLPKEFLGDPGELHPCSGSSYAPALDVAAAPRLNDDASRGERKALACHKEYIKAGATAKKKLRGFIAVKNCAPLMLRFPIISYADFYQLTVVYL